MKTSLTLIYYFIVEKNEIPAVSVVAARKKQIIYIKKFVITRFRLCVQKISII